METRVLCYDEILFQYARKQKMKLFKLLSKTDLSIWCICLALKIIFHFDK